MAFSLGAGLVVDQDISEVLPMRESSHDVPAPDAEHYREMARALRELARQCRFPGARRELLRLAANYERRAEHFESRAG
jgi:hypothetical protein